MKSRSVSKLVGSDRRAEGGRDLSRGCARILLEARHMISPARCALLGCIALTGCGAARDAAVTSFRILDAPANYVRQRIAGPETTTTTTTTTQTSESSDVVTPGRPITPQPGAQRRASTRNRSASSSGSTSRSSQTETTGPARVPAPSATPRPAASQTTQFPTARPVAGRPGYVYSIDPKGGIVDVTGYKSGDKAKDPYTQQIFIVP